MQNLSFHGPGLARIGILVLKGFTKQGVQQPYLPAGLAEPVDVQQLLVWDDGLLLRIWLHKTIHCKMLQQDCC